MRTVRSIGSREKSKITKEMERKMQPQNARAVSSPSLTQIYLRDAAPRELHVRRMLSKYPAEVHETILHRNWLARNHRALGFCLCNYLGQFVCADIRLHHLIFFSSRYALATCKQDAHAKKSTHVCVCATIYRRRLVNCRVWFRLNRLGV
jgi:hypothetical protein